ncbi:hypothetical protein HDU76_007818, partial [Blyttiomyces sp. JEL0837]
MTTSTSISSSSSFLPSSPSSSTSHPHDSNSFASLFQQQQQQPPSTPSSSSTLHQQQQQQQQQTPTPTQSRTPIKQSQQHSTPDTWRTKLKSQCLERIKSNRDTIISQRRQVQLPTTSSNPDAMFESEDVAGIYQHTSSPFLIQPTQQQNQIDQPNQNWLQGLIASEWSNIITNADTELPTLDPELAMRLEQEIQQEWRSILITGSGHGGEPGPWVSVNDRDDEDMMRQYEDYEEYERRVVEETVRNNYGFNGVGDIGDLVMGEVNNDMGNNEIVVCPICQKGWLESLGNVVGCRECGMMVEFQVPTRVSDFMSKVVQHSRNHGEACPGHVVPLYDR